MAEPISSLDQEIMNKVYRIFHLIKSLGRGGAEVLLEEGLRFADRNHFTYGYGYFLPWKNAVVSGLEQQGGEVVCFKANHAANMILAIPRVTRFLKKWKADLVHCHLPMAGVVGRIAGQLTGTPVIYTEHNVMERYHSWTRRANVFSWKWQDWVVAVSHEVSESIKSHAGNSIPVTVVQNGVAVHSYVASPEQRKRMRVQLGIEQDAPVIGTVAVFRIQKDLLNWLKTAEIIRRRNSNVRFLLVGDGLLFNEVKAEAVRLGLKEVVHFTGLQEDVVPYLSAMDIYLNSSIFEGLPISLLEAMSMKLPVVATCVGGVPEVVVDGKTGFLVPPRNPETLAEKVSFLLSNDQLRHQFGLAGRALVEEHFSMQRMTQQLEELYLRVLEKRSLVH
ncbi:glycosyltransferase [bacterium]|nr:glycosyltransferase [bacterium]